MELIGYAIAFLALVISFGAQAYIKSSYSKYSKIKTDGGLTGKEVARKILDKNNLKNVKVEEVSGYLSDHYDPKSKTVRLSTDNYNNANIANVAVAAHECGHAIQDGENYTFLRVRASLVPLVNLSSYGGYFAIAIGAAANIMSLMWIGIMLEVVILIFQLVTLPVEFNASHRALNKLKDMKLLKKSELADSKTVLTAAALTYVASVVSALAYVIRLLLVVMARNRDNDRDEDE